MAKGDDKAQLIKAIDKLNEKSGLYILSGSASDQSSFESDAYAHGYLTYSLLTAMKQNPGDLLNVSKWFIAADNKVRELSKQSGDAQEPQNISNPDFDIGKTDSAVRANIKLAGEKIVFTSGIFLNAAENINDDNLDLVEIINNQMTALSESGTESTIIFVATIHSPDAYLLTGRYEVKGDSVTVFVNIKKNKGLLHRLDPISGTTDKLEELAAAIVNKSVEWVVPNK
jgi:hypothetical protein